MKLICSPDANRLPARDGSTLPVLLYGRAETEKSGSVGAAIAYELRHAGLQPSQRAIDLLSLGSRRISDDAIPTRPGSTGGALRRTIVAELDQMLQRGVEPLTILEFSRRTGEVTGPRSTPNDDVIANYHRITRDLFGTLSIGRRVDPEEHFDLALGRWKGFKRTFSRKGHGQARTILDMISYEARTAMVAWYSDVWQDALLPHLATKYRLNDATQRFLRFWHVEQRWPSNEFQDQHSHLFHGQVFALHPAPALFIETAAGQRLIGRWLSCHTDDPKDRNFQRLLGGIYLSVFQFDRLRADAREERVLRPHRSRNIDESPFLDTDSFYDDDDSNR
jgi:hypothetical protein